MAVLAGSLGFLAWYNLKKKRKKEEQSTIEETTTIDIDTGEIQKEETNEPIVFDISKKKEEKPKYVVYNYTPSEINKRKEEEEYRQSITEQTELEERRLKFEKERYLDLRGGGDGMSMTTEEHYINNRLRYIDKINDTRIWTIMAALFGYDYIPNGYQQAKEYAIIDNILRARASYFGDDLDDQYGTAADILLYFADAIASNTGKSLAGVLDVLLSNGGFFDCIEISDGFDIDINSSLLEQRVEDLFQMDLEDIPRSIFGKKFNERLRDLPLPERTWSAQLDMYIEELLKMSKE